MTRDALLARRRRRVSRRFLVGVDGPALGPGEREILSLFCPAGFILFRRNLVSGPQARKLIGELRSVSTKPVFIGIDQEGGRVDRLAAIGPASPSAEWLASMGEPACERAGFRTGRRLRSLGFDVDFAPVVDLSPDDAHEIGMGGRSFGSDPREVARLGGAFLRGLADAGVAGCLKHFPGLGRGRVDSHRALPVVAAPWTSIAESDLVPFAELLPLAPSVMVSHAAFPSVDPSGHPASISRKIVTSILKERLGFDGGVFADDLEMGALNALGNVAERSRLAFLAGATYLPICSGLSEFPEAAMALASSRWSARCEATLADAEARDRRFRLRISRLARGARSRSPR